VLFKFYIQDEAGHPIAGARLTFYTKMVRFPPVSYTTGSDGLITIDSETDGGLLTADTTVTATKEGYNDTSTPASFLQPDNYFLLTRRSPVAFILAAGAGIGLLGYAALSRGRRIGGFFDGVDPRVKTGLAVAGGLGLLYIGYKIFGSDHQAQQLPDQADAELSRLADQGELPTITAVQAEGMASSIVAAFNDCDPLDLSTPALINELQKLNNKADLLLLIKVFGVRSYKGCFDGDYFSNHNYNLNQAVSSELNFLDIALVNRILANKGINYSF